MGVQVLLLRPEGDARADSELLGSPFSGLADREGLEGGRRGGRSNMEAATVQLLAAAGIAFCA